MEKTTTKTVTQRATVSAPVAPPQGATEKTRIREIPYYVQKSLSLWFSVRCAAYQRAASEALCVKV
jgi:hypothetical protein